MVGSLLHSALTRPATEERSSVLPVCVFTSNRLLVYLTCVLTCVENVFYEIVIRILTGTRLLKPHKGYLYTHTHRITQFYNHSELTQSLKLSPCPVTEL